MNTVNAIQKTGPKDVFMNLLTIIGLYVVVVSFGALVFQLINIYFPDPLQGDTGHYARQTLRWPLSVLVIVFPLYIWLVSYGEKDLLKNPLKRELKTRKWLLYFTLFATTIVIVVDLITLIFRFLEGELTVRFLLKVATVLLIAAAVFLYYAWNVRKEIPASRDTRMRFFIRSIIVIVGVSILAGFFVAGSPQSERKRRFDEQRVSDLQTIQYQIITYWQAKEKLPPTIEDLRDELLGFIPPIDPETGNSYEYRIVEDKSFELCAIFNTSLSNEYTRDIARPYMMIPGQPASFEIWQHDAGHTCFSRTLDPEFFPPLKAVR